MFAVPVITPTYGILDWTIQELQDIDIKTRKNLNKTNNFHVNSDMDILYIPRAQGGRGLKSIQIAYESRIITLNQHMES